MKERPILFSTPMVNAILADLKDITRRTTNLDMINKSPDDWKVYHIGEHYKPEKGKAEDIFWVMFKHLKTGEMLPVKCPYGKAGDILWVRETWGKYVVPDCVGGVIIRYLYKVDYPDGRPGMIWKPSIHMPKEACRLKLKILSIRVERLHDITEEDAIKEGIEEHWVDLTTPTMIRRNYLKGPDPTFEMDVSAKKSFETLWASINGQESWDSNPWVWRIEFKKL